MTVTSNAYVIGTAKTSATKAMSAYTDNALTSESTDRLAEMREKYKDVYTPMPESYTKESEELQQQKIHEAYPDYLEPANMLKLFNEYYTGTSIVIGEDQTQNAIKSEEAWNKVYDKFGGLDNFKTMMSDVQQIKMDYPVNTWGKDPQCENEKELSRFYNAGVYEALEDGKSLQEAKNDTLYVMNKYMNVEHMGNSLDANMFGTRLFTNIYEEVFKNPNPDVNIEDDEVGMHNYSHTDVNFDKTKGSCAIWDLREYGISGDWKRHEGVYGSDNDIIKLLERKIEEYDFLLENRNIVEKANNNLDSTFKRSIDSVYNGINETEKPMAKFALGIFEKYKIYESVDIYG